MALKEILKNNITSYKPLEEIYNLARQEKYYKIATIERELRRLTNNGIIKPVMKKNYIVGYLPKNEKKSLRTQNLALERLSHKELNDILREIMKNLKLSWEMSKEVAILNNAIKSPYKDVKIRIIKKYNCG